MAIFQIDKLTGDRLPKTLALARLLLTKFLVIPNSDESELSPDSKVAPGLVAAAKHLPSADKLKRRKRESASNLLILYYSPIAFPKQLFWLRGVPQFLFLVRKLAVDFLDCRPPPKLPADLG